VVRSFDVTIGAAGSSTPPGRFAVTDLIVGGLNPVYGCCAIALSAHQPNLPEGWIGGDRIAIHGTTGPIGSASSGGCLRAEDDDARALTEKLSLGTPVFITA
jgi:lipoprotein-anchoring transpeptidase ErfK/SrfK